MWINKIINSNQPLKRVGGLTFEGTMQKAVLVSIDFKTNKIDHHWFEGENSYIEAWKHREKIKNGLEYCTFRIIKYNGEIACLD